MHPIITATRYHDFSCGHRVVGHEGKCALLHGHNYRAHFTVQAAALDEVGRVLDFSAIKGHLCDWLEQCWDHRFLAWEEDHEMLDISKRGSLLLDRSVIWVPFNPTAENMGLHLLSDIGPRVLHGTGVELTRVVIEETRKCAASVYIQGA